MDDFSRGENRITRRPLVPVLVGRGSRGRVMIFASPSLRSTNRFGDLGLNRFGDLGLNR